MKKKSIILAVLFVLGMGIALKGYSISAITAMAETQNPEPTVLPDGKEAKLEESGKDGEIFGVLTESKHIVKSKEEKMSQSANDMGIEPTKVPEREADLEVLADEKAESESAYSDGEIICEFVSQEVVRKTANVYSLENSPEEVEYWNTRNYYIRSGITNRLVATVRSKYIVWDYGDKVHLRSREHMCTFSSTDVRVEFVYGNIINTDGSRSYTSGDLCKITVRESGEISYYNIDDEFTP